MCNSGLRFGKKRNFRAVKLDTMGMPHVWSGPSQILCILPRPTSKLRQGIGNVFVIFRQMGV